MAIKWMAMVVCAGLLGVTAGLQAGDIYQWKDAQGVTHMGDVVPRPYSKSAKKLDVKILNRGFNLPPAADSTRAAAARADSAAQPPAPAQNAASAPAVASTSPSGNSCERQKQAYQDSLACFARYREGRRLTGDYAQCPVVAVPDC